MRGLSPTVTVNGQSWGTAAATLSKKMAREALSSSPARATTWCVCVCNAAAKLFLVLPDREDRAVVVDVEAVVFLALMTALQFVLGRQRCFTDLNIANIKAN